MRYLLLLMVLFFCFPTTLFAVGMPLTDGSFWAAPNEVKIAVFFDEGKETIIASETFSVNPLSLFMMGWFIASPSKPEITALPDSFFVELEKRTQKPSASYPPGTNILFPEIHEENTLPSQVATRTIYLKGLPHVVSPDTAYMESIHREVRERGYVLPKLAVPVLETYAEKKWWWFIQTLDSMHMEIDATDAFTVSGAHTQPLSFSFETEKPIVPLKLLGVGPDWDSQHEPFSYYGIVPKNVLGASVERVKALVATPSANTYSSLPGEFSNIKVELYVFAKNKLTAPGFTVIYSDRVSKNNFNLLDQKNEIYWSLPKEHLILTRSFKYIPAIQLEDVQLEQARDNWRTNPTLTKSEWAARLIIVLFGLLAFGYVLYQHTKRNIS